MADSGVFSGEQGFDRRSIPLAARESVWLAADGARLRRIDWQAPTSTPRGSILFMPGRGDFYEKYLETLAHWNRLGWQVTAADWRGQGGSGRLGSDPLTGHVEDFAIWIADLAAFWQDWRATAPGPKVLMGHSMGGHLCLRAVAEGVVDPQALVLSAPMLGFHPGWVPPLVPHGAARLMCALGDPRRPAWKWSEKPGQFPEGRMALLTHDPDRYADEIWWREARPELVIGPGSWRWVERAYASSRMLARVDVLAKVAIPVLVLAATADRLVEIGAINTVARRLPKAELVRWGPEARHELLREEDAVRDAVLSRIDTFLDRVAPSPR